MFNQVASDKDRHRTLQELIKKDYAVDKEESEDDGTHEDEFYDDDQLNEIIARDDKEYAMYSRMDQERYIREDRDGRFKMLQEKFAEQGKRMPKHFNQRLIQEFEVPDWIKVSVAE